MKCRRIFALALAIALLALALTGCGSKDNGSAADGDTVTVKLGVVGAIYDDIWKPVQEALKAEGINLEIVQFSDYVTPQQRPRQRRDRPQRIPAPHLSAG